MGKKGRPTKYSQAIADKICLLISTTSKGLVNICKGADMPNVGTVYGWLKNEKYADFVNNYVRAREDQADLLADEIIEIADKEKRTTTITEGEYSTTTNLDNPARSRLMVDARKWKASKLAPKKYGDKLDVTSKGGSVSTFSIGFKKEETE